jgi:hypothetical protein
MTAVITLIMALPTDRVTGQALLARFGHLLLSVKTIGRHDRIFYVLARLFAVVLGLAAVTWGATLFPTFWSELSIERTADTVVYRVAFKPGSLDPLLKALDHIETASYGRPEALRSATIIRLRLAEEALASAKRDAIDAQLSALQDSVRESLTYAPSDSFLWMILAWQDGVRNGFRPEQLAYLRLSYRLGPYEGWIATRRNRVALSMFERLPPDLADAAVNEFASMVQSQFYADTISILTGPGWPIRNRLLAGLKDVDVRQREEIAKELYSAGYDVTVPGVVRRDQQPW